MKFKAGDKVEWEERVQAYDIARGAKPGYVTRTAVVEEVGTRKGETFLSLDNGEWIYAREAKVVK